MYRRGIDISYIYLEPSILHVYIFLKFSPDKYVLMDSEFVIYFLKRHFQERDDFEIICKLKSVYS